MMFLFSLTLFLSAVLMFWAEPMFGKMALPLLGGAPAVWNTCMVFYQMVLLAGYSLAHFIGTVKQLWLQRSIYLVIILLGLVALPIHLPPNAVPSESNPFGWLIWLLAGSLGLPFLALSTTSPLMQKWYAMSGAKSAQDPYFLFAASNAGSFAALLAYPILLERFMPLGIQTTAWHIAYIILILLTAGCAFSAKSAQSEPGAGDNAPAQSAADSIIWRDRVWWLALSMLPSSLLLGVTSYLSIDIAPVPLLWVIPLALYLLTFILAFAQSSRPRMVPSLLLAALTGCALFLQSTSITEPLWLIVIWHLLTFTCLAFACHGELARRRPPARHLTQFYFFVALGGAIGGLFNALVAPHIFDSIMEYPLAMVLAFALAAFTQSAKPSRSDFIWPGVLVAVSLAGSFAVKQVASFGADVSLGRLFMCAFLLSCVFAANSNRTAIAFAMVLLIGALLPKELGHVVRSERNFFGVKKVVRENDYHWLMHGTTYHGGQSLQRERVEEPLTYYHPTGPLGDVFGALHRTDKFKSVAVIGLGVGAMSHYVRPGESWTFFEIDPAVADIAQQKELFSFLQHSRAPVSIVLGDARLKLASEPNGKFDLIVVDAFGSDAIPVHLITKEAVQMYKQKLSPHGLLLFHVSNQQYRLGPVLANIAADAGFTASAREHVDVSEQDFRRGIFPSHWVLMYRDPTDIQSIVSGHTWWNRLKPDTTKRTWTDDFSDVLSVVKWAQ